MGGPEIEGRNQIDINFIFEFLLLELDDVDFQNYYRSNRSFLKLFKTLTEHVSSDLLKHLGIASCNKYI
jgi:hypothetical protein